MTEYCRVATHMCWVFVSATTPVCGANLRDAKLSALSFSATVRVPAVPASGYRFLLLLFVADGLLEVFENSIPPRLFCPKRRLRKISATANEGSFSTPPSCAIVGCAVVIVSISEDVAGGGAQAGVAARVTWLETIVVVGAIASGAGAVSSSSLSSRLRKTRFRLCDLKSGSFVGPDALSSAM